jgi:hypothetical protein
LIKSNFPALGITGDGYSDSVMMSGTLDTGVDNPMISAVPSNYLADETSGDAGEMDY